jgi:tRNA-2-methylthio-N6-dimethylallyladenosine synthase
VRALADQGFKEITLLGQNVNSYRSGQFEFADLMLTVAAVDPSIRVRFTTSHPQDMSDRLIASIAETQNICKHIHLPVQSGSDRILRLMNRTYAVDGYRKLVDRIRKSIPGVSLTTDIISGFPTETEAEHLMTIDLLREIRFDGAFTFKYSPREKTKAWEMGDDIPDEEKGRRVWDITRLQHEISGERNRLLIGSTLPVLVEGPSRKSAQDFTGRTDDNRNVVFPHADEQQGDLVDVRIERSNSATLFGVIDRATVRRSAEPYQEDAA